MPSTLLKLQLTNKDSNPKSFLNFIKKNNVVTREEFPELLQLCQTDEMRRHLTQSLLHSGIKTGDLITTKYALEHKADVNDIDSFQITPLSHAIKCESSFKMMNLLWDYKADINKQDPQTGLTPLLHAIDSKNSNGIFWLLEHKADAIVSDKKGLNALHHAVQLKTANFDLLNKLNQSAKLMEAKDCEGSTILHHAARVNNSAAIRWALEYKADVNAVNSRGWTPLHEAVAAWNFDFRCLNLLMEYGANLLVSHPIEPFDLAKIYDDRSAILQRMISFAMQKDNEKLVHHLVQQGLNTFSLERLLFEAINKNDMKLVKLLFVTGVDPNAIDEFANTFLNAAVQKSNVEMIRFFLEKGTNVLKKPIMDFARTDEIRQILSQAISKAKQDQEKQTTLSKNYSCFWCCTASTTITTRTTHSIKI